MVTNPLHAVSAALLALVIAMRLADGTFTALVQTWYEPLLLASVVVLLACAVPVAWQAVRDGGKWRPSLQWRSGFTALAIGVVVALGISYTPRPLDGSSLDTSADIDFAAFSATADQGEPIRRNVYQWAYAFSSQAPSDLLGLDVSVVGFVHHPGDAPAGTFLVARFVVACCVADARGYSLPVQWVEAHSLPPNAWVRVTGQVRTDPSGLPVVGASTVDVIDAPSNPYIYP